MKKQAKDGWHKIAGYEVYVQDGKIIRGISADGSQTLYPYRFDVRAGHGWDLAQWMTPDAFRAADKRGHLMMT